MYIYIYPIYIYIHTYMHAYINTYIYAYRCRHTGLVAPKHVQHPHSRLHCQRAQSLILPQTSQHLPVKLRRRSVSTHVIYMHMNSIISMWITCLQPRRRSILPHRPSHGHCHSHGKFISPLCFSNAIYMRMIWLQHRTRSILPVRACYISTLCMWIVIVSMIMTLICLP